MSSSKVFASAVVLALAAIGFLPGHLASGTTPPPPPTIVLPAVGSTVSGQNVILDAIAPAGTTSVEYGLFQYDGMAHQGLQPTPVAYAVTPSLYGWFAHWNTTDVPNGSYDLFAVATVNGISDSTQITTLKTNVTVDNPLPSVSIGFPSNGATLSGSEYLTASVPYLATVSFLLTNARGTTYLGESWDPATGGTYPFMLLWNSATVPNGLYTLEAVAEYPGGLSNAASVSVRVSN